MNALAPDEAETEYTLGNVTPLRLKFDLSVLNVPDPNCPQAFEVDYTINQVPIPGWLTFDVKLQVALLVIQTSDSSALG